MKSDLVCVRDFDGEGKSDILWVCTRVVVGVTDEVRNSDAVEVFCRGG